MRHNAVAFWRYKAELGLVLSGLESPSFILLSFLPLCKSEERAEDQSNSNKEEES